MPRKILRLPIVLDRTGLSRSTVYQRVTEGRFPRPVSLGARAVGWIETEVEEWIARQIEASREIRGPESWRESFVVKMTPERDSGLAPIWDWIAGHGLILCRPS